MDQRTQNAVLGKILWHQFNTVVILRQNMRQKTMTIEDSQFRLALENMRFGACTEGDLTFLKSKIAGFREQDVKLNAAEFRNVSVITARNSQKDTLNKLGSERFATDTSQALCEFYSIDKISSRAVDRSKWKGCEQSPLKSISKGLRKKLWDAPPSANTEFIPGKLTLCVGMPIMIRSNDATELCITKGQEAVVVGWDSSYGPFGQPVLDTLFVKLVNPPRTVSIADLPENVVPLPRVSTNTTVLLEDDSLLSVNREQVVALLNFGMTDYTSQGKSRAKNVVDLTNCRDHRSYYVALSRGFTAAGTAIVQGFDTKRITSGISGYLRQELRELETLDEITKLLYERMLPPSVTGIYRVTLLRSFYAWRKQRIDPPHFHKEMQWDASMGPEMPDAVDYGEWKPSDTSKGKRKVDAINDGDTKENPSTSRKIKKSKFSAVSLDPLIYNLTGGVPVGIKWDSVNHSCAYDAIFTILTNIWAEQPHTWTDRFADIGDLLKLFVEHLQQVSEGKISIEECRDVVRRRIHSISPEDFPYGPRNSSIDRLARTLIPEKEYGSGFQGCVRCGFVDPAEYGVLDAFMCASLNSREDHSPGIRISEWLKNSLARGRTFCPSCRANGHREKLTMNATIHEVPPLIILMIDHPHLLCDTMLHFDSQGALVCMKLKGIVYGGHAHFTCRIICNNGAIWYHDGITTGRHCKLEGNLAQLADISVLNTCMDNRVVAVVYGRT
jgi:hypothetical protein